MPDTAGFTITDPLLPKKKKGRKKEEDRGRRGPPQRDKIVAAVLAAGVSFWRDADGNGFASVPEGECRKRFPLRSAAFRKIVRGIYGEAHPSPLKGTAGTIVPGAISDTAWREALPTLEAIAFRAELRKPQVRLCGDDGGIWIDLGAPCWGLVRVTQAGWQRVADADVPLIRPEGLRALPVPQREAGALDHLRRLLNLAGSGTEKGERDLMLVLAWLVAALHPAGPYPLLALDGEQGSGKSTLCRILRRLVDPNACELRAAPRNEDDLVIAASNGRVVALDNISFIEADMADAICRVATGGGLGKRRLYTDGEEHIVEVCRPVLLNGIPSLLARGDLADRALAITLPPIQDAKRRPEREVWTDFEAAAPGILALLLDGLARALRDLPGLTLPRLPRMADFARLACAAAPAFGWTADVMLKAIEANRAEAVEAVLEADPIAGALQELAGKDAWTGTPTALLEAINLKVPLDLQRERGWPKDAARLSTRLKRIAPALRRAGVEVGVTRSNTGRTVTLRCMRPEGGQNSVTSVTSVTSKENQALAGDAGVTLVGVGDAAARGSVTNKLMKTKKNDAGDAGDAVLATPRVSHEAPPPGGWL